jgi:hypothetical protein
MVQFEELALFGCHFVFERMVEMSRAFEHFVVLEGRRFARTVRGQARKCPFIVLFEEGNGGMLFSPEPCSERAPRQSEHPRREGSLASKGVDRGKYVDEDFQGRLFGVGAVTQPLVEKSVDPSEIASIEFIEGGPIAFTQPVDQYFIVG